LTNSVTTGSSGGALLHEVSSSYTELHLKTFICRLSSSRGPLTSFQHYVTSKRPSTQPALSAKQTALPNSVKQMRRGYFKTFLLHGLSPRANYTDRATAACRRSDCQLFANRWCHVVSVTDSYGRIFGFLDRSRYFSIK
jgi:hypothetical protein